MQPRPAERKNMEKKSSRSGAGNRKFKWNLNVRITFNSPVILTMVGICFLATLLNYLTFGRSNHLLFSTYRAPLYSPMTWIRWFTHIFGHADWSHFIGNTGYLLLLGPMLEEKYGAKKLITVIAITALVAGVLNFLFFPQVGLLGASGVVFAFILLSSFTSFKEGEIPLTFILVAVFYIGQQVVESITVRDHISYAGHIVGGITGAVLGFRLNGKSGNA